METKVVRKEVTRALSSVFKNRVRKDSFYCFEISVGYRKIPKISPSMYKPLQL